MKKERQTFLFYRDWYDMICKLDDKTALEVCKSIMYTAFGDDITETSDVSRTLMMLIRPQIERDIEKWKDIKEKRREVGRKGGVAKATNCYQLLPNDSKSKQNVANVAVNVDNNIINNNSVDVISKEKEGTKESTIVLEKSWRNDYDIYKGLVEEAVGKLFVDETFKRKMEDIYQNIDYERTVIACSVYWEQEEQWEAYKRKRNLKKPNLASAIKNGFHLNKVYKSKNSEVYGYPKTIDDMKEEDIKPNMVSFYDWVEKKASNIWNNLSGTMDNGGWPNNENTYRYIAEHTIGGFKGLCYTVLVLNRDGWDKYDDERGFLFVYSNYIKANGMYIE